MANSKQGTVRQSHSTRSHNEPEQEFLELNGSFYHLAFFAFFIDDAEKQDLEIQRILEDGQSIDDLGERLMKSSTIQ